MPDSYKDIYVETQYLEEQRRDLQAAQRTIQTSGVGSLSPSQKVALEGAKRSSSDLGAALGLEGDAAAGGDAGAVTAYVGYLDKQISNNVARLYSIDADLTYEYYPDFLGQNADEIKKTRALLGGEGGGAAAYHPPVQAYNFSIGPGGDVVRTNSVTGAVELTGMKVPQGSQVVTNTRDGHSYAVNLDTGDRQDLGVVAFPELDPERKFRFDVLATAANLEQSMAGIELQRRGQVLKAIGDDFSNQVALGNMVYTEANINLNRIDKAFTQRREERAQLLKYAVQKSSLRQRGGQETTLLPFGGQIAGMLTQATGKTFTEQDFELATTYINPDQVASEVMAGSDFTSPIPGLTQSMQQARASMDAVLGAPMGSQAATKQITQMAIPGA